MAECVISEKTNNEVSVSEKFYKPLSLSGYLTPLQRKKLREKRNCQLFDSEAPVENKKFCEKKRKKRDILKLSNKSKELSKIKRKTKEHVSQVQCNAAKIILKTFNPNEYNKKFFKAPSTNRLEKANFTMPLVYNKNSFVNIEKCIRETICYPRKHSKIENNSVNCENFKNLSLLSDSRKKSTNILQLSDSYVEENIDTENVVDSSKVKSVFDFDWPADELLLKRQEAARAVLRIQNKSQLRKLSGDSKEKVDVQPVKLYPIFHAFMKKEMQKNLDINKKEKNVSRKIKDTSKGGEQMIIDAGQKEILIKTCKTCNMIYTIGQEEDERLHSNYHNMYLVNLKFPGWKEENVIGDYGDGRVVMIRNGDKSMKLKKVQDVLVIANRDLGFPSSAIPTKPDLTFLLFISSSKQVVGCLIAEGISSACRVIKADSESELVKQTENTWKIGNWYSSSETVPAICGINRIWVAHGFRRQKIASRMVDCLRCNFIHGHIVGIRELAFTDPSPDGRQFAATYTGTDNFLVYK